MAVDQKLSELTSLATPASTDLLYTVQGGSEFSTTRSQLHSLEAGEQFLAPQDTVTPGIAAVGNTNSGIVFDTSGVGLMGAGTWILRVGQEVALRSTALLGWSTGSPDLGTDVSIARTAANTLALRVTSGNVEALKVDNDSTAGNTRLLIYDVDNALLERVTVGAVDSGGAGFKVLRIPN